MSPLFIPGPVDVPPEVLAAQARPILDPCSEGFNALLEQVSQKTRPLFNTSERIYLLNATADNLQETAVRSLVKERVLACVNGPYAARWAEIAETNHKIVDLLEAPCGQAGSPDQLEAALQDSEADAVLLVHNDPATGVENPLAELAEVIHHTRPEMLILVDAVSSAGGVPLEMDTWGIDFLFTLSAGCLALPPGLALASFSARARKKASQVENRGWHSDILRWESMCTPGAESFIPPVSLIYALNAQLERITLEGWENRFARHVFLANRLAAWTQEKGLKILASPAVRSNTITVIENNRGIDIDALNTFLLKRGMRIAGGYGLLRSRTLRIAHMGEIKMEDLEALLAALDEFLAVHLTQTIIYRRPK
ncbi:MAG: aminotransferase class V-fold PLP-dependent enzyme [Anaerolineaceae bacterium]|nr:aminotransferase class V-fold PLP-dependent enzyme [Anaerolineaceae bacterium]